MFFTLFAFTVFHVLLPVYFAYLLVRAADEDQLGWFLKAITGGAFALFLAVAGRWDWFSIYLRYVPVLLFAATAIIGYRRIRERPLFVGLKGKQWLGTGLAALETLVAVAIVVLSVVGQFYPEEPVRLSFPLQDGTYYVGQGGNSVVVNYHHPVEAQAFAADVTELDDLGVRAGGFYPQDREQYAIFGEPVYSPCDGTVTSSVDSLPGADPPQRDADNPAGNHVMIACKGVSVLLAHFQRDSVTVEEGQTVTAGEQVGRVGNSGNTTEPHLHIHAVRGRPDGVLEGDGVPMLFDGTFPVRNTTFE